MQTSAFDESDAAFLLVFRPRRKRLAASEASWCHRECNHHGSEERDYGVGFCCGINDSLIHASIKARSLNALGSNARLASPCGETNVACGDSCKRFDHELFLSCPHAGLEIVDGVIPEDRNFALTHDRAGVVLGINEMNRNARFRLTGFKHRLEHTIPVHPTPTESRQECRMSENSPLESSEYEGPQFLHVTGQKNDVDCSRNQHISNRRV